MWRLNMFLINGSNKNSKENQKILKLKWKYTYKILWDAVKIGLRGKLIAVNADLKKQEKSQINNITLQGTRKRTNAAQSEKVSKRKEIEIREGINKRQKGQQEKENQ